MQCTEYSRRRLNLTFATLSLKFIISHKAFPVFHADRVILSGYPAGQGQPSRIWKVPMWSANNGKGMLFSVTQAFVGRDEIRAPLKTSAWKARPKQRSKICGISQRMILCNQFSFGNVCWQSLNVWYSWPGIFLLGTSWCWGRFFSWHNPYSGKIFWC